MLFFIFGQCISVCNIEYEIICICKDIVFLLFQLEGKVISIPGKLEEVKVKLDKQEKVHDQIIQLKPQRNLANSAKVELDKIRYVLVSFHYMSANLFKLNM